MSIKSAISALSTCLLLAACHPVEDFDKGIEGNFDALWTILDEHYCFFDEKDIDWKETGEKYRARITPETDGLELFTICSEMLDELKDGHVNLSSTFAVSYYRKWWTDYPQNFDLRLIQEHYLEFDYTSGNGGCFYKLLPQNVGYMRYGSFTAPVGDTFLDIMLYSFKDSDGLIIDVRDNGGGDISRVENLVSRFIDSTILAGSISHKTGPGHSDFSEPFKYYYSPATDHVRWLKPVVVLANRSTFSAANNFVAVMKTLPHVLIVGDTTGGGCGMPFSSELPGGWSVRFSACPVYGPDGRLSEHGVDPSPGCRVDMTPEEIASGRDAILDFAIRILNENAPKPDPAE